jgi:DNA repair protein RadC
VGLAEAGEGRVSANVCKRCAVEYGLPLPETCPHEVKLLDVYDVDVRRSRSLKVADKDIMKFRLDTTLPVLRELLAGREQESFAILITDSGGRIIAWRELARGTTGRVDVPVAHLFRTALLAGGSAVVVAHNHPSGDPTPSEQDVTMTKKLAEAGMYIDCPIIDHIIIGEGERYYSFVESRGSLTELTVEMNKPRQGPELD